MYRLSDYVVNRIVGDGVLDVPAAEGGMVQMRRNLPIEVKFLRRVVGDADPYG